MDGWRGPELIEALRTRLANDLRDVDGRPLGEIGSRWWADTPTELVPCPYADAREGRPMNRSALRQAGRVWPRVVAIAHGLAGEDPTVQRAWQAAVAGTTAPAAFHLRNPDQPVPRVLSALYKTSLGFSQVLTTLLLTADGVADAPLASLGTGSDFFALLDEGRWLVGDEQVCAGSQAMIVQLLDALAGREGLEPESLERSVVGVLGDPAEFTAPAATIIGLQVAHLGAVYQAGLRGEPGTEAILGDVRAPWLRGVLSMPGRRPEHARRLFEAGRTPAPVEDFLAAGPASPDALGQRLRRAIDEVA